MLENYAEQASRMQAWMRREGYNAHVIRLPDGRPALVPGEAEDRSRQARWDARNRVTVSCSAPKRVAEAFREACETEGYTVYGTLRRFIDAVIAEHRRTVRAGAAPRRPLGASSPRGLCGGRHSGCRGQCRPGCGSGSLRSMAGSSSGPVPPRAGLRKPELRRPYDWTKEEEHLTPEEAAERDRLMRIVDEKLGGPRGA